MSNVAQTFLIKVRSVVGISEQVIALHEPIFDQQDIDCVKETVQSGWVSYQGEMVKKFEQSLADYLNVPFAISIVNGTSALFIALKSLGIQENDEVIVPALTFVGTANAVHHIGAIPHFVDVERKTFGIDYDKLEEHLIQTTQFDANGTLINKTTKRKIKAIIPVYILGAPFNIDRLIEIAEKFNLKIIEDAAEAMGSTYHQKKIGAISGIGILSFNGNKIITTGGGGAIILHDESLASKIRHMVTTAKLPHRYEFEHDEVGYNLRLPAINAALGFSQMQKLNLFLERKRNLYNLYKQVFADSEIGEFFDPDLFGKSNCWLNAFVLKEQHAQSRNLILDLLNDHKIAARPFWKPLHLLGMNQKSFSADCSVAQDLYHRVICLPSSQFLGKHA